jgi:curved DNA-binding protein CbpA
MAATGDHYATLQVEPDVDEAALRHAYRAMMRRYHPDVNVDEDAADQCHAISEAYACLRDPARRAAYDAQRRSRARQRLAAMNPALHPTRPTWSAMDQSVEDLRTQSRQSRALGLAVAIVLTIATFAATSAVNSGDAREDEPVTVILKPSPEQLRPTTR